MAKSNSFGMVKLLEIGQSNAAKLLEQKNVQRPFPLWGLRIFVLPIIKLGYESRILKPLEVRRNRKWRRRKSFKWK